MAVAAYALRRGPDGELHGPVDEKARATSAGRKAAAARARAGATKRGSGPGASKAVRVVIGGAKGSKQDLGRLFPGAVSTPDVCRVAERLRAPGLHVHPEGSAESTAPAGGWKELVYAGRAGELVEQLKARSGLVPARGPGNRGRRKASQAATDDSEPRSDTTRDRGWRERDLVPAGGPVGGAVRRAAGERLDGSGMRRLPGRADAALHLRCTESNGDWEAFVARAAADRPKGPDAGRAVRIRSDRPLPCEFTRAA